MDHPQASKSCLGFADMLAKGTGQSWIVLINALCVQVFVDVRERQ